MATQCRVYNAVRMEYVCSILLARSIYMKLTIKKWGRSAAIPLPESILTQLGAKIGDSIELNIQVGVATLRATKPRYRLADLLAPIPRCAPAVDWDVMPPVGKEVY